MIKRHFTLTQTKAPTKTEIHIEHDLLYSSQWVQILRSYSGRVAIITDTHVKQLIADKWTQFLKKQGIDATLFSFSAGEESKSRHTKERLEDEMHQLKFGRDTLLVAIGGGVVTDLGGYLASTFNRGISLVLVPTTLLGMVDAAIGGKTGVNTPFGKNLIGTFYPPKHIFIDTSLLSTLPEREWRNGMAEIVKCGLISSPPLFQKLFTHQAKWQSRDREFLQEIIYDSISIKKEVVESDFQETGVRRVLNFGHTIAHAIETLENYRISHGEAVAIGMLVESYLSYRMGLLHKQEWERIEPILQLFNFSLQISPSITLERIHSCMSTDKKAKGARPRFVLLQEIGKVEPFDQAYCTEIEEPLLNEGLTWMLERLRNPA
jgi:3-dehydroquinate synthase